MIFHMYNPATDCFARICGEVLARCAGLPQISFSAIAKHRGIFSIYRGSR